VDWRACGVDRFRGRDDEAQLDERRLALERSELRGREPLRRMARESGARGTLDVLERRLVDRGDRLAGPPQQGGRPVREDAAQEAIRAIAVRSEERRGGKDARYLLTA